MTGSSVETVSVGAGALVLAGEAAKEQVEVEAFGARAARAAGPANECSVGLALAHVRARPPPAAEQCNEGRAAGVGGHIQYNPPHPHAGRLARPDGRPAASHGAPERRGARRVAADGRTALRDRVA